MGEAVHTQAAGGCGDTEDQEEKERMESEGAAQVADELSVYAAQ